LSFNRLPGTTDSILVMRSGRPLRFCSSQRRGVAIMSLTYRDFYWRDSIHLETELFSVLQLREDKLMTNITVNGQPLAAAHATQQIEEIT
jgi:hypothetical protein